MQRTRPEAKSLNTNEDVDKDFYFAWRGQPFGWRQPVHVLAVFRPAPGIRCRNTKKAGVGSASLVENSVHPGQ